MSSSSRVCASTVRGRRCSGCRAFPVDLVVDLPPAELLQVVCGYGVAGLAEEGAIAALPSFVDAVRDHRHLDAAAAELPAHAPVPERADRSDVGQHARRGRLAIHASEVRAKAAAPRAHEYLDDRPELRTSLPERFVSRRRIQRSEVGCDALDLQTRDPRDRGRTRAVVDVDELVVIRVADLGDVAASLEEPN